MIYIFCSSCKVALHISPGEPGECEALFGPQCEWYPDKYPCFKCGENKATIETTDVGSEVEVHDVTPREAYAAVMGLGVPTERECSAEAIRKLLNGRTIKKVSVSQLRDSHRCLIDHLELDDGSKVYFGAGSCGSIVYRVTPPYSYTEAIDHE